VAVQLIKPSAQTIADPAQALIIQMRVFEALSELQKAAATATPESVAAASSLRKARPNSSVLPPKGAVSVAKIAGATVTDPQTGLTFVADVYVSAVRT
jgi:threonine dehydratase